MKFVTILFFIILPVVSLYPQITTPVKFSVQDSSVDNIESSILGLPNNDLQMFWIDEIGLQTCRSTDNGITWASTNLISSFPPYDLNSVVLPSGRILLIYRYAIYYYSYSDDNGLTWSSRDTLRLRSVKTELLKCFNADLSVLDNGSIVCTYNYSITDFPRNPKGIYFVKSVDGLNWTPHITIDDNGFYGDMVSLNAQQDMVVYHDTINNQEDIFCKISTDNGNTWSSRQTIISTPSRELIPQIVKDNSNKLWMYYLKYDDTAFQEFQQQEIYSISSTNSGISWSNPEKFTNYIYKDSNHAVSLWNGHPILSFTSSRNYRLDERYMQIYYGTDPDDLSPPYLFDYKISPEEILPNEPINLQAYVDDNAGIDSVIVLLRNNFFSVDTLRMFDDGLHGDSLANDKIFGIILPGFLPGQSANFQFLIYDDEMNIAEFAGGSINAAVNYFRDFYSMDINRFKLPFDNKGVIGYVYTDSLTYRSQYDEGGVLFAGGFFLTGNAQNNLWAAGQAEADRTVDFQPGTVGSFPDDSRNKLFVVKASDPAFGESWQNYVNAVELGAKFYDGNLDSVYNPIDLNGNGIWDLNEDRPDILGDITLWCVYNDGVPSNLRRYIDQFPVGVEVQQTVFAIGENISGPIDNMFFIRYLIKNSGTILSQIDSVYFTGWADIDIGNYEDDVTGCDTLLELGFGYNNSFDQIYGENAPAIGITVLQGPVVYIPGETFIDLNSNGVYDPGIDTAIDTAIVNNGLFVGSEVFPGAKNLSMSSYITNCRYFPGIHPADESIKARYYSLGLDMFGDLIDPCTFGAGEVRGGVPCNLVNPIYMFSGNPVQNSGWLNTWRSDQRIRVNTGPFNLIENEPVEIWLAYVVGRGTDSLNSVSVMKDHVEFARQYYNSNFIQLPVGVEDDIITPDQFTLYQNFPNPFNPKTIIRYQIPNSQKVTIKIYDILGREISTMVNEIQEAGQYEVEFNGSNIASGVYFYQLKAGDFIQTKKMILMK